MLNSAFGSLYIWTIHMGLELVNIRNFWKIEKEETLAWNFTDAEVLHKLSFVGQRNLGTFINFNWVVKTFSHQLIWNKEENISF